MTRSARRLVLAGLVWLAAGASVAAAAELEGHWWGEELDPRVGMIRQWLVHLKPDHRFEVEFRFYARCVLKRRTVQSGRWELVGDLYRTVTDTHDGKPIDPSDKSARSEYVVRRLDDRVMEYHDVERDHAYRALRVPAGYTFPRCLESS